MKLQRKSKVLSQSQFLRSAYAVLSMICVIPSSTLFCKRAHKRARPPSSMCTCISATKHSSPGLVNDPTRSLSNEIHHSFDSRKKRTSRAPILSPV